MSITLDCHQHQGISVAILLLIETMHSKRVDTISKQENLPAKTERNTPRLKYQFVFPVCPKLWSTEKLPLVNLTLLHNNKFE
jgi:hypothetical protein